MIFFTETTNVRSVHFFHSLICLLALVTLTLWAATSEAKPSMESAVKTFDHDHPQWTELLQRHVHVLNQGQASQVDYAGFAADHQQLKQYLKQLSAVPAGLFKRFDREQQLAFLINAYNAFTIELILTSYPDLESIKDLGSLLSSPWKKAFIPLLGKTLSLDNIEQDRLRERGIYDEPRIHFAVNCASIGCPSLREEAYVSKRLETQLNEQTLRFLSDRSRNRFNPDTQELEISKIFDWYEVDFEQGFDGIDSVADFLAGYAQVLADKPADRALIGRGDVGIDYLDYDWNLNDVNH